MKRIFVHGLGQTPDSWKETIARSDTASGSVCPDLAALSRGNQTGYQQLYRAFSDFCGGFQEELDFCGLSLGGVLALHYAIEHPQKVRSLVLIATPYKMPEKLLRLQNFIFRLMPEKSFQQTGFGKEEFIRLCKTMMRLDFSDSLREISCPVLVLCGEKDSVNKKASIKLAEILKNAEFQLIRNAGHEVNVDAPERLAECLAGFYSRI